MKQLIVLLTLNLFYLNPMAQTMGTISGSVVGQKSPLEFATLKLYLAADTTKPWASTMTDAQGKFQFNQIHEGIYFLKVSMIGFTTYAQKIILSEVSSPLILEKIELNPDPTQLKAFVVSSKKKLIEKTDEGFIINAASNITQVGGTATDLLKVTPTIAVDNDGVITLRGKTPLVLINGRISSLSNTDLIAASNIESIEVITSASAKYDANAESGIINIKLKKNKQAGTQGAVATGVGMGSRIRTNGSGQLSHKIGKLNWELGYDQRYAGRTKTILGQRNNLYSIDSFSILQNRMDERIERLQNLKFNVDYTINEKQNIHFETIGSLQSQDNDEHLISAIHKNNEAFNTGNDRHSWEYRKSKNIESALTYSKNFTHSKKNLRAGLSTSLESGKENTEIQMQDINASMISLGNIFFQQTHNYEKGTITNANVDFAVPASAHVLFETGYKGTFRNIQTDYETADKIGQNFILNANASNLFNFKENIHALYTQVQGSFPAESNGNKWKYTVGLRAESVNNNGNTHNNSITFRNDYIKLFPNANIGYLVNDHENLQMSYGKRINRPRLGQLNPFVDITDILNPHSGNPDLQPEIIHAWEFTHFMNVEKFSISSNLFYRHSINTIKSFFEYQPNGTILSLPRNIGKADSYGIENMLSGNMTDWFDFNASITLLQQKINGTNLLADAQQQSFNWYGKMINNIKISNKSKLQMIANYTARAITPQGNTLALYNIDFGWQQTLGKSNFKMNIVIVDAFNSLKSGLNNYTSQFKITRSQKADTRAFMLTLAYSFRSVLKEKMLENKFSAEF